MVKEHRRHQSTNGDVNIRTSKRTRIGSFSSIFAGMLGAQDHFNGFSEKFTHVSCSSPLRLYYLFTICIPFFLLISVVVDDHSVRISITGNRTFSHTQNCEPLQYILFANGKKSHRSERYLRWLMAVAVRAGWEGVQSVRGRTYHTCMISCDFSSFYGDVDFDSMTSFVVQFL